MDPTANLEEQRKLVEEVQNGIGDWRTFGENATRLAELAEALDKWISSGGFLPAQWKGGR